jgi:hypothetical protein
MLIQKGWLKGVNSTTVGDGAYDMGTDGFISGTNSKIARIFMVLACTILTMPLRNGL